MINQSPIIVLDACVLAGTYRRLLLLALISEDAFWPVVSERILSEARRAIPKTLSNSAMKDAEKLIYADHVINEIMAIMPSVPSPDRPMGRDVSLPDPDDEHVLALALESGASIIVTENIRDFPKKVLEPLGIEAIRTDAFASACLTANPSTIPSFGFRLREVTDAEFGSGRDLAANLKRVGLKRVSAIIAGLGT